MHNMKRNNFNLNHHVMTCGRIGNLVTLDVIPVLPGDIFSYELRGLAALSPLRRAISLDAEVHLSAYYMPHRFVYGNDDWFEFLEARGDLRTDIALARLDMTGPTFSATGGAPCLAIYAGGNAGVPRWRYRTYPEIWNYYFRDPSDEGDFFHWTDPSGNDANVYPHLERGQPCMHMPRSWNTGVAMGTGTNLDDYVTIGGQPETPSSDEHNFRSFYEHAQAKADFKNDIDRIWYGRRYNDIVGRHFAGKGTREAEQIPELIAMDKFWLGGYNSDGTSGDSLGAVVGKSQSSFKFDIPRRYIAEHGAIWVVALVRFAPVVPRETTSLESIHSTTYGEFAGDYQQIASQEPKQVVSQDYFFGTVGHPNLVQAAGEEWRFLPNKVHNRYIELKGFPFNDVASVYATTGDGHAYRYINSEDYDTVFRTHQLEHWNIRSKAICSVGRFIPKRVESIYAGVNA